MNDAGGSEKPVILLTWHYSLTSIKIMFFCRILEAKLTISAYYIILYSLKLVCRIKMEIKR